MLKYIVLFLLVLQPCFAYEKHQNVYFNFDKFKGVVDALDIANYKPGDIFLIKGYADPVGTAEYNQSLSQKRAEAIKQQLIFQHGIDASHIKVRFYGEDIRPGFTNGKKRRVEVVSGTLSEINSLIEADYSGQVVASEFKENSNYKIEDNKLGDTNAQAIEPSDISSDFKKVSEAGDAAQPRHRNYLGLGAYHNVVTATDKAGSEAKWVSDENYNIEAQYQFKYKGLWLGVRGSYHIQNYEVELNPIFTWDEKTPDLMRLSLVSDYEKNKWGIGFDLDYNQSSFIYEQGFNVELRDIALFGVSLRGQYKWLQTSNWSSRLGVSLSYPLSGSDQIDPMGELGYISFIDLKRDKVFGGYGLNAKVYYGFRNHTNNQNDQEEEVAGIQLSLMSLNWL